jgi:hypothetical protein
MPYPIWHVNTFGRNNSSITQNHFDDFCSFCFFFFINNILLAPSDYCLMALGDDSCSHSKKKFCFLFWRQLDCLEKLKSSERFG